MTILFNHTLSPYSIAKYEVTYELWYTVRQWAVDNGYAFQNPGLEGNGGSNIHANTVNQGNPPTAAKHHPVTYINWRDIIVWCNAYSEMSGRVPAYSYEGSVLRSSINANGAACDGAVCNWTANGFRLPTEGEWQYAASYKDGISWTLFDRVSGASEVYSHSESDNYAWSARNSGYSTKNVGTLEPNALGIHDMSGNVWEFCWDYDNDYPEVPQTDYRGPSAAFIAYELRIMRGGCIAEWLENKRIGYRNSKFSTSMANEYSMGFRVARNAE